MPLTAFSPPVAGIITIKEYEMIEWEQQAIKEIKQEIHNNYCKVLREFQMLKWSPVIIFTPCLILIGVAEWVATLL